MSESIDGVSGVSVVSVVSEVSGLLARRSVKLVGQPGPSEAQIEQALAVAVCAPDHAKLRGWRFALVGQPDIVAVGEKAFEVLEALGKPMTPEKQASTRAWLKDLPLLVAMAYQVHHDHPKVPALEQTLSMGAAVMNFENAMHSMGYSSFWSTGLGSYTDEMAEYFGFDTLDYQFVGYLGVGTPKNRVIPAERPDPWSVARWFKAT
jgi:nitroreductase